MKEPEVADTLQSGDRSVTAHRTRRQSRVRIRHADSARSRCTTRDPSQSSQGLWLLPRKKDSSKRHRNAKGRSRQNTQTEDVACSNISFSAPVLGSTALLNFPLGKAR